MYVEAEGLPAVVWCLDVGPQTLLPQHPQRQLALLAPMTEDEGREDIDVMGSDVQGDGPPDDIHED